MKPIHLKTMLIASGFITVACVLFLNSKSTNLQQFRQEIQLLRDVRLINALVNQELLTIRYQLFTNFDSLSEHISKLKSKHRSLIELSTSSHQVTKPGKLNILIQYLNEKFYMADDFKTANALLKNSLTVFPNLNTNLQFKLESYDDAELIINHVDSLLRDIYLYSLTNDDHVDGQLLGKVETLENLQFRVEPEITPYLHVIYKHAKTVIDNRQEVNSVVSELLNLPIESLTYNLQKDYTSHNEHIVEQSNIYRIILGQQIPHQLYILILLTILHQMLLAN